MTRDSFGFDLGNQTCSVASACHGSPSVLRQEIKSLVYFGAKQRQLGADGADLTEQTIWSDVKNTVTGSKQLLGKAFHSPDIQSEQIRLPFQLRKDRTDRIIIDGINYLNEERAFSPVQVSAMLISGMKEVVGSKGSPNCVISVPAYFTNSERWETLNAAQIAGVNCLGLVNDTTAAALYFALLKFEDFSKKELAKVVFIDAGYSALQVLND